MGRISTLNVTILAKKIVKIGQLELNIWVFHVAASRFICIYQNLLVNQCFLLQYPAWNISGHHGIIQYTKYDYFSQKIIQIGQQGLKTLIYREILIGANTSALFDMEKPIFSAPIDRPGQFFWLRLVTFSVLIHPMMTRNVLGWVLEVKTLIYQEILIGANKSALCKMEKLIFLAPIYQSG